MQDWIGLRLMTGTLALGMAVAFAMIVDVPAKCQAQAVLPSQVTPPTMRPPSALSGAGPEAPELFFDPSQPKKKRTKADRSTIPAKREPPGAKSERSSQ